MLARGMENGRSSGEDLPGHEESNGKAVSFREDDEEIQGMESAGAGTRGLGGGMGAPKRLEVRELGGFRDFADCCLPCPWGSAHQNRTVCPPQRELVADM